MEAAAKDAVAELMNTESGKAAIAEVGGPNKSIEELKKGLTDAATETTMRLNQPFVTAFCSSSAHDTSQNGLLSQWRGYGFDGGYAVVFSTKELADRIELETARYSYQFFALGEDYDDEAVIHPEERNGRLSSGMDFANSS
jgi:hypothetical protein